MSNSSTKYDYIISIDPSLSNTGVTIYDVANDTYEFSEFSSFRPNIGKKGQELKSGILDFNLFCDYIGNKFLEHNEFRVERADHEDVNLSEFRTLVIVENMYSHNINVTKVLSEIVGVIKYLCYDYEFRFKLIKPEKGKGILKTMTGKSSVYTEQRKELSTNYFLDQNGYEVSDDIADSFILLKYYLQEMGE